MSDEAGAGGELPSDDANLAAHPLTAIRLEKHLAHEASGGYPYRYERSHRAADLHEAYPDLTPGSSTGHIVSVAGRIRAMRRMGKLTFAVLQDGSGTIQLFVNQRVLGDGGFARFDDLDIGDIVGASGEIVTSKQGELSVLVDSFELLAKSLRPLPDKWHGLQDLESRSRRRYVDLIVNEEARQVALTRARVVSQLRREFEDRGYVEVETPVLLNQATGALARPFETHHNALDLDMSLRIATELYLKRLVVGGIEKVFEIGRIFRNEGLDATHNPEFTMLESYEAYADYGDIATMVEEIFAAVAGSAHGSTAFTYQGRPIDLAPPYRRMRMTEAVAEVLGGAISFTDDLDEVRALAKSHGIDPAPYWRHGKIIEALFDALVADEIWEPTFVMDHPKEVSPLARQHRTKPELTERWELFIAGSEYANAFSELNDPIDQRRRFESQAAARVAGDVEAHPIDVDYIRALEYGLPPTGGLGIGVDRLVMLLTDRHHIREVILFPTLRPE